MENKESLSGLKKKDFHKEINGKKTDLFFLRNANNLEVAITNYGGAIVAIMVPDREGKIDNIIQGHDNIEDCIASPEPFLSTLVGRYGNRICRGTFTLNGKEYHLAINNGPNHLHGGPTGFHRRLWHGEIANEESVVFSYFSPDGEEGYPGNLIVSVKYTFDEENRLTILYRALCDRDTVINLTNHTYFNLDGHDSGSVEGQRVKIFADSFTENDENCLPTGRIVSLDSAEGAPMDFRSFTAIGEHLHDPSIHLKNGSGYDHNYILKKPDGKLCARVYSPTSRILLDCRTTEPGLQFYTGNFLSTANIRGKGGAVYADRGGFCLETQHFPNAMQHPHFPSVVLPAGDLYRSVTEYRFDIN